MQAGGISGISSLLPSNQIHSGCMIIANPLMFQDPDKADSRHFPDVYNLYLAVFSNFVKIEETELYATIAALLKKSRLSSKNQIRRVLYNETSTWF